MEEKIKYNSENNIQLCGLFSKVNDDKKIVILCHGLKGDKTERNSFDSLVEILQKHKINSFRFDFRGHGESSGNDYEMTITKEIKDLEKTIEMLKEKGFEEFILLGASFGGAIISLLDYKNYKCIKGLISWYGALDFNETIEEEGFFSDEHKKIAEKNGFFEIVSKRTGKSFKLGLPLYEEVSRIVPYKKLIEIDLPILFIHGLEDKMIPFQLSENVCSMCKNAKINLIKNGDHTFNNDSEALQDAINRSIDFVKEHFKY